MSDKPSEKVQVVTGYLFFCNILEERVRILPGYVDVGDEADCQLPLVDGEVTD